MLLTKQMITSATDLLNFDVGLVTDHINREGLLPQEEFIRWLMLVDAIWTFNYEGDPKAPHALLTSGNHSDGFVDCLQLLKYPRATEIIVEQLVKQMGIDDGRAKWVFGSPMAGVTLAFAMARRLRVIAGFTDKTAEGKVQKRFKIKTSDGVLLVEELITTLKTTREQINAIGPANCLPLLGVFFNRSGETTLDDIQITSVVDKKITNWTPEECPLCKNGSEAIKPKQNWERLVAT